jgi:hypothetical protein
MAQATSFKQQLRSTPTDTAASTAMLLVRDGATDPKGEGRI